eukprot:TRINITY_DN58595_c0_g1_i1.p1 TRINITY_DN58595_c0_g1~~TRINITY_DN58595_c0_g1_i1.p1  ORF type:complete len:244 (+),score=41.17 TRINITY_DN58595_c0_g1_i1:216-947(+)
MQDEDDHARPLTSNTGTDSTPGEDAAVASAPVADDLTAASGQVAVFRGQSLYLAIVTFFSGKWLDVHFAVLLALMPLKGIIFAYPRWWQGGDVVLLAVCFLLRQLQRSLVVHGDRTANTFALAASLGLLSPVFLSVGYFSNLQVYVLQLEFVLGVISVCLLSLEVTLGSLAGLLLSSNKRETVVVFIASALALITMIMSIVAIFHPLSWDAGNMTAFFGVGLGVTFVALCVAVVGGTLAIELF